MKFILILTLITICACAQVTVTAGKSTASWPITMRPKTVISSLTCDLNELEPGEFTTCTVTINQPARAAGFNITATYAIGLTGPANLVVTGGSTLAFFRVDRPESTSTGSLYPRWPLRPSSYAVWIPNYPAATRYRAEIGLPCCARIDGCSLPQASVAQWPCATVQPVRVP